MANIIPPLVEVLPKPPAAAVEDNGPDWEPGPGQSESVLELLYDAKAGHRTVLDLFTPEEREQLLRDLPPKD